MFITIKNDAIIEIIEKKSRFIGHSFKIENEKEAEEYLLQLKKEHYKANHNCFAYQIDPNIQKFSDDGEPGGTAGRPILDVLKGKEIKNVLIVVTRYFGGTLLGTGGLVRAYSRAAKEVISAAGLVKMVLIQLIKLECSYADYGKIEYLLKSNHYMIRDIVFTDTVAIFIEVEIDKVSDFLKWIIDKTNNVVQITKEVTELVSVEL